MSTIKTEPILVAAKKVTNHVYDVIGTLPADERYLTVAKLRSKANDILYDTALGLSNSVIHGNEYEWASVKKHAEALRTMYDFAVEQGFLEKNNDFDTNLDFILSESEKRFIKAKAASELSDEKQNTTWQTKYQQWLEMRDDES